MGIWYQFNKAEFVIYGAITYLILSQLLRGLLAQSHRRGMAKVKSEKFAEAIPIFEKSYNFFKKYDWVDKYRFLTLLSSGRMTYKEMALNNIAFCYGQMGNGKLSKEYYERTLSEYPDSGMAKAALRMLNSVSSSVENGESESSIEVV